MKPYVHPTITLHRPGASNPFARAYGRSDCETLDSIPVADLIAKFGSPLYVFSERTLRETFRRVQGAFRQRYKNTTFAWSYKTNYLRAICSVFHQEGALAEVVSDFEYEKARGTGMKGNQIIFNGPHKSRAILERAIDEGAHIQVDHHEELDLIESILQDRVGSVDLAIRIHLDAGIRPVWSKFGFGLENGAALEAVRRIAESDGRIRLVGIHCHIGTYILDPEAYRIAMEKMIRLAHDSERISGVSIRYYNMGGGLPSNATLHTQYLPASQTNPSLDAYVEAITSPLLEAYPDEKRRPVLYLESGRALVDEAGYLITSVVANKRCEVEPVAAPQYHDPKGLIAPAARYQQPAVLVDAGVHLLYTGNWFRINFRTAKAASGPLVDTKVLGCLCMNIDVLRESVQLPPLRAGDALVLHPVGAYNITQSMQFITYRPAVVMISESGEPHVIRVAENLKHIEALERVPDHLQL